MNNKENITTTSTSKLSVIIVNYNVKYFLEQCLRSVLKASHSITSEIFVVDNNSVDGSVNMLQENFPNVNLILNDENVGFSKANNQAIKRAQGEFILLLNPDTVVEEDTFQKIISFMENTPDAGGLGVKMVDGKGQFLPESKRGLPTPIVAFYKIFGIAGLFPKSHRFGKYHLTFLSKDEIHQVDILSGACMVIRKKVLDEIGVLDESFFMYGEDIDLSYRITKAGYKNYYFPETRIIHYKGESTKKGSLNYVIMFYKSMRIFARKHFSSKNQKLLSFFITIAIYFRASIALLSRIFNKSYIAIADFVFSYLCLYYLSSFWERFIKHNPDYYPKWFFTIVIPVYLVIWIFSLSINGAYKKPFKLKNIVEGLGIGTVIILVLYGLLPELYRFSRALIFLGATSMFASILIVRFAFQSLRINSLSLNTSNEKRFIIIGNENEATRVSKVLQQTNIIPIFIGYVAPTTIPNRTGFFLGSINQLEEIITVHNIDELIFCAYDLPAPKIMDLMASLENLKIAFKIAPAGGKFIIGSDSINSSGEFYATDINKIMISKNRQNKRLLDIIFSFLLITVFPFIFYFFKPKKFFQNIKLVLLGKKSWVGYASENVSFIQDNKSIDNKAVEGVEVVINNNLPKIKDGILTPLEGKDILSFNLQEISKQNKKYARNYTLEKDIRIIIKGWKNLDR